MSAVDPKCYDKRYFLSDEYGGGGEDIFSRGEIVQRFKDAFRYAGLEEGMKVLDIGCGRGEMVCLCASKGIEAVGIDYSCDAIELAERSRERLPRPYRAKARFLMLHGFEYPFADGSFDRVFMLDVAEHLSPEELSAALGEARRLLKEGGEVFVDTSPNRLFNDYAYPLWERPLNRCINRIFKTDLMTRDARNECDRTVHINEQTPASITRYLRAAGFTNIRVRMHPRKVVPRKMGNWKWQCEETTRCVVTCLFPASCFFPLNRIFCNDIIAVGRRASAFTAVDTFRRIARRS